MNTKLIAYLFFDKILIIKTLHPTVSSFKKVKDLNGIIFEF